MEQRITFDFDFQRLTDVYLGGSSSSWTTCFAPQKLRRAAKRSRSEQLYIVLKEEEGEEEEEEQQAIVVWKRLGLEPKVFSTNEVEDMIISTRPRLGGNKVVVKLVGDNAELLEIYSLQEPEMFVEAVEEMKGGKGGKVHGAGTYKESKPRRARVAAPDAAAHATTHITARDPPVALPRPNLATISPLPGPPEVGLTAPAPHDPGPSSLQRLPSRSRIAPPLPSPAPTSSSAKQSRPSFSAQAAAKAGSPPARMLKRDGSIGGEAFTNPLFAHGKIIYHLVLPESVPPHLFYKRSEVEGLVSGDPNKPVQQLLREHEQQRIQREFDEMQLAPSRTLSRSRRGSERHEGSARRSTHDGSLWRGSDDGSVQGGRHERSGSFKRTSVREPRLSTLEEDQAHYGGMQAGAAGQLARSVSWRDKEQATPMPLPMAALYQPPPPSLDRVRSGPLRAGLLRSESGPLSAGELTSPTSAGPLSTKDQVVGSPSQPSSRSVGT